MSTDTTFLMRFYDQSDENIKRCFTEIAAVFDKPVYLENIVESDASINASGYGTAKNANMLFDNPYDRAEFTQNKQAREIYLKYASGEGELPSDAFRTVQSGQLTYATRKVN